MEATDTSKKLTAMSDTAIMELSDDKESKPDLVRIDDTDVAQCSSSTL